MAEPPPHASLPRRPGGALNAVVRVFLHSNLPLIFILLAAAVGLASLMVTPREEDPQIVVPMADVFVQFPGRSAGEVEQLVSTPLERILYQIDGVEYVYSSSREDQAVITVRFYVGEDRERSLVKLFKKMDENLDLVPPGVTGWVVKPVEIDDVPIVTLTLTGSDRPPADEYALRRVGEELVERLAAVKDNSRAYVVGGRPRTVHVYLDPDRLRAHQCSSLDVQRAVAGADVTLTAGEFSRNDRLYRVQAGRAFRNADELRDLVVAVRGDRPVFLKDLADVRDGPEEVASYVRHGWGPARGFDRRPDAPGAVVGRAAGNVGTDDTEPSRPAVTIAVAKKKGANAVRVADEVLAAAGELRRQVVPDNMDLVVTRNTGLSSNNKVNELIEALLVAMVLAVAVLLVGLGRREALIVALAVPVVFGLTLTVNLLAGLTINRVTLFALILSLGLLVDDPIVDVENITRHFALRKRASRQIVLEAVSEIRPPLIAATLAVIASFLPLFFITGMMGPYMRPMALNVPVTMVMSMVVAFCITPYLTYHLLKKRYSPGGEAPGLEPAGPEDPHAVGDVRSTRLYRLFRPLLMPLISSRRKAWTFLGIMGGLTLAAVLLAAIRLVPLKMLPYGNKDTLQLVLDLPEGTTLERTDAAVRDFEAYLRTVPEVVDFTSYVGLSSPMDFNGLVRHYYLRRGENLADVQVNLVEKKQRRMLTHATALRIRDDLTEIASRHEASLKIVEVPPGPPVLATVVAEVYGPSDRPYADLISAAKAVRARLSAEPGVADLDDTIEDAQTKFTFVVDKEKAALHGVTTEEVARTLQVALGGSVVGTVRAPNERRPLAIQLRLPRQARSSPADLSQITVRSAGATGPGVALAEIGRWDRATVDQTIYHKNLRRVAYVLGEVAGRAPAAAVVDVLADRTRRGDRRPAQAMSFGEAWVETSGPRAMWKRTYLWPAGGLRWFVPEGIEVGFAGEGEWKITLEVFRDMGLAFLAALAAIYILLVAQTASFVIPLVVMLAIPLTFLGILPGFWLLNVLTGGRVGGYPDPVFFTATGMIGMIALAGIVTRASIIIVDFIHLALARGRSLPEAILESCVVRLRPILLTVTTAMLAALPIATDPVFSGLAWSLIFGLLASTVFTLLVVPVTYWLLYAGKPGHGMPVHRLD